MTSYQRMAAQLRALRLYRMDGKSLIEAETAAYGAALEPLFEQARLLLKDCFLDEEDNAHCGRFEQLFHFQETPYPPNAQELEKRRAKIRCMKGRLKIRNTDFSKGAVLEAIATGGMTVSIQEDFAGRKITVTVLTDEKLLADEEEKRMFIKSLLPVHSAVEVVFS